MNYNVLPYYHNNDIKTMILYQTSITFISKLKTLSTQDLSFIYSYMLVFEYIVDMNRENYEKMYTKLIFQLDKIIKIEG